MRHSILGLLLFFLATPAAARRFTGIFAADARPKWMALLTMTETERGLSGLLLFVQPNREGGTTGERVSVEGSSDGGSATLHTKTFLGLSDVTFAARFENELLLVTFATGSGELEIARFARATAVDFNAALASWRRDLSGTYSFEQLNHSATELLAATTALRGSAEFRSELLDLSRAAERLRQFIDDVPVRRLAACGRRRQALEALQDRLEQVERASQSIQTHSRDVTDLIGETETRSEQALVWIEAASKMIDREGYSVTPEQVALRARALAQLRAQDGIVDRARSIVRAVQQQSTSVLTESTEIASDAARRWRQRPCLEF